MDWKIIGFILLLILLVVITLVVTLMVIRPALARTDHMYPVWWTGFPFYNYPTHTTIWSPRQECYTKCDEIGVENGLDMTKCFQKCGYRPDVPIANYFVG